MSVEDNPASGLLEARPLSNGLLVLGFCVAALLVLGVSLFGQYPRRVSVPGYIVPDKGLVRVFAPQAGTVSAVFVSEGAIVQDGQVLPPTEY